jgi:hypothetical protein
MTAFLFRFLKLVSIQNMVTSYSLFWWVTAAILFTAGIIMHFFVGNMTEAKLKHVSQTAL